MTRRPAPALAVAGGLAGVVLAGVGLAGCSSGDGATVSATARAASSAPAGAPSPGTPPDVSSPSPAASSPSPDGDAPVLTLQGDGLGLLAADDSVAPLPFTVASAADVQQAVEDALGATTTLPRPACPQGPRTALQVDGFTVLLDGDAFVGWTDVGAPDRSLTTAEGVGAGSHLSELRSAVPDVQVTQDPGGTTTFASAGGLSGVLTGPEPTAVVSSLSAGQTCPTP